MECQCTICNAQSYLLFVFDADIERAAKYWVCFNCFEKMSEEEKQAFERKLNDDDKNKDINAQRP